MLGTIINKVEGPAFKTRLPSKPAHQQLAHTIAEIAFLYCINCQHVATAALEVPGLDLIGQAGDLPHPFPYY